MTKQSIPRVRFKGYDCKWDLNKIGKITSSYSGGTPKSGNKEYYEGEIPFIRSGEIKLDRTELFINEVALSNSSAKMVEVGDILYALYGATSGEVSISKISGAINQAILALKPSVDFNSRFIVNFLEKEKDNILDKYLQGGQGNLSATIIKNIDINAPEIAEQSQIGSLFSTIDSLLSSYKDNLENYQSFKNSMLSKMFPTAGQTVPGIRLDGFEGEWVDKSLRDMSESIEYGLNAASKEYDGQNKYLRITDIDDVSRAFIMNTLTSPDIILSNSDEYLLKTNDILFARTGASVGKSYLYKESDGKVYFAGFLIRARIKQEYDGNYIFQNTLTERYNQYIEVTSQRSGQPGVNGKEYGLYRIMVPDLPEQQAIGSFFSNFDDLTSSYQSKIEELVSLKKKLLQDMFI